MPSSILPPNVAFFASILSEIDPSRMELQSMLIGFYPSGSLQCWMGLAFPKVSGVIVLLL